MDNKLVSLLGQGINVYNDASALNKAIGDCGKEISGIYTYKECISTDVAFERMKSALTTKDKTLSKLNKLLQKGKIKPTLTLVYQPVAYTYFETTEVNIKWSVARWIAESKVWRHGSVTEYNRWSKQYGVTTNYAAYFLNKVDEEYTVCKKYSPGFKVNELSGTEPNALLEKGVLANKKYLFSNSGAVRAFGQTDWLNRKVIKEVINIELDDWGKKADIEKTLISDVEFLNERSKGFIVFSPVYIFSFEIKSKTAIVFVDGIDKSIQVKT